MAFLQILLTAAALAAAAGGTWGGERLLDLYARIPAPDAGEAAADLRRDDEEEPSLDA